MLALHALRTMEFEYVLQVLPALLGNCCTKMHARVLGFFRVSGLELT